MVAPPHTRSGQPPSDRARPVAPDSLDRQRPAGPGKTTRGVAPPWPWVACDPLTITFPPSLFLGSLRRRTGIMRFARPVRCGVTFGNGGFCVGPVIPPSQGRGPIDSASGPSRPANPPVAGPPFHTRREASGTFWIWTVHVGPHRGDHRMAPESPFGPGTPRDPRRNVREPLQRLPYVRGHSADQRSIARGSPRHAVSGRPGILGWIRDRNSHSRE